MGVTVSKCLQVDYELFELDFEKPIDISTWSLSAPHDGSQSTDGTFTLQELTAAKYQFAFSTSGYASDRKFSQRCIDCTFTVHHRLPDVRVMASMELDGDQFDDLQLNTHFTNHEGVTWKETQVGDLEVGKHQFKQLVYMAADMTKRVLHVFICSQQRIVMKARVMLMVPEECRGFLQSTSLDEQAMRERENRLQDIILAGTSDSPFFALHHPDHLAEAISTSQSVRRPAPLHHLTAAGHATTLAMRQYDPPSGDVQAVLLLLCTNNSFFMDPMAASLANTHHIAVQVAELRGFGHSGGKRGGGDVARPDVLYADCRTLVKQAKWSHPSVPIVIGAHFLMCGLALNYVRWRGAEAVDGMVLMAPHFGQSSRAHLSPNMRDRLEKSKMIHANKVTLAVAKWSKGRWGGGKEGVSLPVDDNAMAVNPMLVNHFSASWVMAWNCQSPARAIKQLHIPTLAMLGSEDEFFEPSTLPAQCGPSTTRRHQNTIIPAAANLTLLTSPQSIAELAKFILAIHTKEAVLMVVKRVIGGAGSLNTRSGEGKRCAHEEKPEILNQLGQQARQAQSSGVRSYPTQYLESHDHLKLAYHLFRPTTTPTGTSVLVFLAPLDFCTALQQLSTEHGVIGIRFDTRGSGQSGGRPGHVKDGELMFCDISRMIRQARLMFPGRPVFLGGVVGGTSLAINYVNRVTLTASHGDEMPSGLLLVNPLVPPNSKFGTAESREMFKKEPLSVMKRVFGFRSKIALNPQVSAVLQTGLYNAEFFAAHLLQDPVRDAVKAISSCPSCLLLSTGFALSHNQSLYAQLEQQEQHILTSVTQSTGDLVDTLQHAVETGGPWMSRLAASMSTILPLPALTITSPHDLHMHAMISRGSFGTVWLASRDDAFMAVKVLPKDMLLERQMEHAVRQEARCMHLMRDSKHTVSLLSAFEDGKAVYLVMEYLVGGELLTLMMRRGRVPWPEAAFYLLEISRALHEMHELGIVYRDLKPENVLLDSTGHVRLVDFGFAEHLGPDKRSTRFCGSPFYVAPEMLATGATGHHDHRVDWWSLGVVLFEMLTGRPPFVGDTANQVYKQVLFYSGGRSALRRLVPAGMVLEEDVVEVLAGLLEPDPDRRSGFKAVSAGRALKRANMTVPPFVPVFSTPADTTNFPAVRADSLPFDEWMAGLEDHQDYFIGVLDS